MNASFNERYWTDRYAKEQTGWDLGDVSTPLKEYFDQLTDLNLKILIPGAGNAYEAEYLWSLGFKNITVIDLSARPLENIKKRIPEFPSDQLIEGDFFGHDGQYDLIIEQTFFCALDPELRESYVGKMPELLKLNGKLVGLLFKIPLNTDHPPFGGNESDYRALFSKRFEIERMEEAYNSIPPRQGSELFIKLKNLLV
jgi:SAM-dependent methyltransferase